MALRVWLPLNGNLENKGLSNISITGAGSFVDDGKLGKGYTGGAITMSQNFLTKTGTICFWIKVGADAPNSVSPNNIFASSGTYGRKWDLFLFSDNTSVALSKNSFHSWGCVKDTNTGSANKFFTYKNVFPNDTWVHVAVAHDEYNQYIYINGSLYGTQDWDSNGTFTFDGVCYFARTNSSEIIYNDLRIYDECLSSKQIKEISKGLVAHYKLEGIGANANLLLHADKYLKNSPRIKTGTGTDLYDTPGVYYNGLDTSKYYIYSMRCDGTLATAHGGTSTTDASKKYWTAWLYYQDTPYSDSSYSSYQTPVCYHANCSSDSNMYLGNIGNRYYWRVKPPYANCSVRVNAYSNGTDSVSVKFWDFKLEEGTKLTTWLPNQADALYNALGYNNIITRDSSGNEHHLSANGTQTYNPDSARYSGSTKMGGTNTDYLRGPILDFLKSPFTFNCWIYQTSATSTSSGNTGNTLQFIMGQGRDCGYAGFALCSANGYARLYLGSATSGIYWGITDNTVSLLNGWHMLTGTFDGTNAKLYVDGELKKTQASTVDPVWTDTGGFVIGKMSYSYTNTAAYFPFVGSVSDAKIYATALSADDILTTYKNSGIIDNKGNVYAYEFKEE